jgi:hypothetical protein
MTNHNKHHLHRMLRLMRWPLLCGLLGFALAPAALATDPLYDNEYPAYYTDPAGAYPVPPTIDASNFLNNSTFEVTYENINLNTTFFETWNTLNYTNNGTMICDMGFQFDTQTSSPFYPHVPADNFFNPGTVRCGSILDYGAVLSTESAYGLYPQAIVSAANIQISGGGSVVVGQGGLIQLTGQSVELSQGVLTLEGGGAGSVQLISPFSLSPNDYSGYGVDTNAEWNPTNALTATTALPSEVRIGNTTPATWEWPFGNGLPFPTPVQSPLLNTTPYEVQTIPAPNGQPVTNDVIYRYVFVQNTFPGVTANVYIDQNVANVPGAGAGTVELVGSYVNPMTGLPASNYLYVRDDYALGASANPGYVNGIPGNFTFTLSTVSLATAAPLAPNPSFYPFPNLSISNSYSFADVQCVPTSVPTNSPSKSVTNYLAILPSRIQIFATSNLDLSQAQISGENFVSVAAPNQLNGSAGAAISSAYSDINIGVTNGSLMATNLLEPLVPAWSGTVQAWSTRFINLITNSTIVFSNGLPVSTNSYAITNDYRVLIVASQANPTTPTEVWNMALNATNSIIISDDFNILNSLYMNCVSLTLTTNAPGAPVPYGELNLQGGAVNWAASTPFLRYLTNDGDILLQTSGPNSLGVFGSPSAPYGALINNGLIEDQGSEVWATNFVNGGIFYNGIGSFTLLSQTATLTGGNSGGYLYAEGDVSITTGTLLASNLYLEGDRSLTVTATNLLTDTGVANGGFWYVGLSSIGNGIKVPVKPPGGGGTYGNSLLGTTIELFAPSNRTVVNVWAGSNDGVSPAGYTNNLAVGQLFLDSIGAGGKFTFNGTGPSNAIYVDRLELLGNSDYNSRVGENIPSLLFNTNLVIYYADAVSDNADVSVKLNGFNTNHLIWMPMYAGYFSSTNILYPDGSTYAFNAALAQDSSIDSDGDGIVNSQDPTPFLVPSEVGPFGHYLTNSNTKMAIIWHSVPNATNQVTFSTNLASLPPWIVVTNFISPPQVPPVGGWPITNLVLAPYNSAMPVNLYRISVWPNSTNVYGPGY